MAALQSTLARYEKEEKKHLDYKKVPEIGGHL